MVNHSGKKFGEFTTIEFSHYENGRQYYICKCVCGKILTKNIHYLQFAATSCGCCSLRGRNKSELVLQGNIKKKNQNLVKAKEKIKARYGNLTTLDIVKCNSNWNVLCKCDCGKIKQYRYRSLKNGLIVSCGCEAKKSGSIVNSKKTNNNKNKAIKSIGEKHSKLKIIDIEKCGRIWFRVCECECGNIKKYHYCHLVKKQIVSCGCLQKERSSILGSLHGLKNSRCYLGKWIYVGSDGKTIKMRSSYEIMFAQILDNRKIEWWYEPKIFKLQDGMRYIPDFLTSDNKWYEVKGRITDFAKIKMDEFIRQGNDLTLITIKEIEKEHPLSYYKFRKNYKEK